MDALISRGRAPTLGQLVEQLARESSSRTKLVLHDGDGRAVPFTGPQLSRRASSFAALADDLGLRPGDRVLIGAEADETAVAAILGCIGAGLVAVPAPSIGGGRRPADLTARLSAIADRVRPSAVVGDAQLCAHFPRAGVSAIARIPDRPRSRIAAVVPDGPAVVQFTSGTTGDPRGCTLRHSAVRSNLDRLTADLTLGPNDVAVGWLPLYHDMGLFGLLLLPLSVFGMKAVLHRPETFARNPLSWLMALDQSRATISPVPVSAIQLTERLLRRRTPRLDLSPLRNLIIGAEPIDPASAQRFVAALEPCGLSPLAIKPAYGLAEATVYVSRHNGLAPAPRRRPGPDASGGGDDPVDVEHRVSLGSVDPDEVRIRPLDPRWAYGEVELSVPSLMSGYWTERGLDRSGFTADGWFRTGDLGAIHGGELVIAGRLADRLVVGGRLFHAADVERCLEQAAPPDLRLTAAVFQERKAEADGNGTARPGTDDGRVVGVVECRRELPTDLLFSLATAVEEHLGLRLAEVHPVGRGGLPRTTSGKLRRGQLRLLHGTNTLSLR